MYDVIIIGSGPAGLTAAANTSHRGLKTLVIEKQDMAGGLPTLLYPDKIIRDHPGFPVGILGKELIRMLHSTSSCFNPTFTMILCHKKTEGVHLNEVNQKKVCSVLFI